MKQLFLSLAGAVLAAPLLSAQVIDVDQPSVNTVMAAFYQPDLAQSFIPNASDCVGAGVSMAAAWGLGGTFTVELWTALPNAGGQMLASGTVSATPGTWADVFWSAVPVTPGVTYYLVFRCTDGGMAIEGDVYNPYPGGQVYANSGFGSFPGFDYTFHTWTSGGGSSFTLAKTGSCPGAATISVSGATPNGTVAMAYGVPGAFTIPSGPCAGVNLGLSAPTLAGFFSADGSGNLSLSPSLPAGVCGLSLQAVDMSSCTASNVVML